MKLIPLASSQHNLYDLYLLLCVQWLTPDDGQRYCPKHVESYSNNKFEKLVILVGFIIRIHRDARSSECQTKYYFHSNLPRYIPTLRNYCCQLLTGKNHSTEDNRNFTPTPKWEHRIQIICFLVYLTMIYKLIIIRVEWQWWYLIKAEESGFRNGVF